MKERTGYYWDPLAFRTSQRVKGMNEETQWLYRDVLDEIWINGSVPDDPAKVATLITRTAAKLRKAWPQIRECLHPIDPDETPPRLTNERVEIERKKRDKIRKKRAQAGSHGGTKSGETRRKKSAKHAETDASNAQKNREANAKQSFEGQNGPAVTGEGSTLADNSNAKHLLPFASTWTEAKPKQSEAIQELELELVLELEQDQVTRASSGTLVQFPNPAGPGTETGEAAANSSRVSDLDLGNLDSPDRDRYVATVLQHFGWQPGGPAIPSTTDRKVAGDFHDAKFPLDLVLVALWLTSLRRLSRALKRGIRAPAFTSLAYFKPTMEELQGGPAMPREMRVYIQSTRAHVRRLALDYEKRFPGESRQA